MRFLSLTTALLLFLGCVSVTPAPIQAPAAPPPVSSPCETVMQTYCAKGDACGTWPYLSCAEVMLPACSDIVGITVAEANDCSEALILMPCDAPTLPRVCFGVGVMRGTPANNPPGVSL